MTGLRNPFSFLFARSKREDYLAQYVIREHARGRPLTEILEDPYVRNRSTPEQRGATARATRGSRRSGRRSGCSEAVAGIAMS
jgi:hypothetical protein